MNDSDRQARAPAGGAKLRHREPDPQLFPHRIDRRRTGGGDGLWLIWWFVTWVDNLVRPFIPRAYLPETYLPMNIPGLGLIIVFLALTLLGFLTANLIGRKLIDFGDGF